ncbi:MAG: hypothetical protein U0931_29895 [Vulcanimicrobiota bacterium]
MSQDNEFNQGDGLKGHWHDVLAAEGSLLTACGQHTSKAKRMQAINNKMLELINGDGPEEYRPMKMQDVLKAVRGH